MAINFIPYSLSDKEICLALFDMNCPEYFAPNEREDYNIFLFSDPKGYELCIANGEIAGAFGLMGEGVNRSRIDWILLDPGFQGSGVGSSIMNRVLVRAGNADVKIIDIATSQKAYMFFEKFGVTIVSETENGWGAGMHKIDMVLRL